MRIQRELRYSDVKYKPGKKQIYNNRPTAANISFNYLICKRDGRLRNTITHKKLSYQQFD